MIFLRTNQDLLLTRSPNFIQGGTTTMANTWTAGSLVAVGLLGMIGALFVWQNRGTLLVLT